MSFRKNRARLFVNFTLSKGIRVDIAGQQFHYLKNVLRIRSSQTVSLFNGVDGEWKGIVTDIDPKKLEILCKEQTRQQDQPPDIWYLFAPLKKTRLDFAIEKVTELGVARIWPVVTEYTQTSRVSTMRLQAIAMEATEQCGGLTVPKVEPLHTLAEILSSWPRDRILLHCDEQAPFRNELPIAKGNAKKIAILIGPEGGFSARDRDLIGTIDESHAISLGRRILRAETAAVAAFSLLNWHAGN